MSNKSKISYIKPKDHDDWLEIRREGIGGSDASTIVELNKFMSPYMLWLNKLGRYPEAEQNEAMRQGHDFEDYVAKRFCAESGKKVRRCNRVIKNSDYPWAHATIDRQVIGENAGLECKTINKQYWQQFEGDEFPPYYYVQCLHYMAVTGADKWYLAVLVFQDSFHIYEFERDEEAIESLMQQEKEFWELVKNETPPALDGSKASEEALNYAYSDPQEDEVVVLYGMGDKADELAELEQQKKEIEAAIKRLKQEFKEEMGNATIGETDNFVFNWKPVTTSRFQVKAFIEDHPDIDLDPYYKKSTYRKFTYKEQR